MLAYQKNLQEKYQECVQDNKSMKDMIEKKDMMIDTIKEELNAKA